MLFSLGLLLLVAQGIAAQSNRSAWLRGSWEGTGYQTDDASTWLMKVRALKLTNGRFGFAVEYPSLNCGGRWQPIMIMRSRATFREVLDHGQQRCADHGLVTLERVRNQLIYTYSNEGTREITATAVLNKKKPTQTRTKQVRSNI